MPLRLDQTPHLDLMVSGVCVEETQCIMSCGSIDDLINAGEREGILRAVLVEVFKIDTKTLGLALLRYYNQVR